MSTRTTRRRIRSPPQLPPVWGQDVAPPPTPFFASPNASPLLYGQGSNPVFRLTQRLTPIQSVILTRLHNHGIFARNAPTPYLTRVSASNADPAEYSLDNEAERQKLEQQTEALRIQNSQGLQRRQNWVQSLNRVDNEIQELELLSANGGQRVIHHRRTSETSSEMAGNHTGARAGPFQPRSVNLEQLYHEALPSMNKALSHSGPAHLGGLLQDDAGSVMSFSSSIHSVQDAAMSSNHSRRREDIDNKIECVNSLVSLLGCTDIDKMSRTFEAMSSTAANCELMRSHRVIPLLVQLLHGTQVTQERPSREVRFRVAKALYNIVQAQTSHPNEKQSRKKEAKILKLLENLRLYADFLRDLAAAIESQQFPNCEELARRGCQFVCIKTKKQSDASDLIICDISQGPEGSKSSRSSLNEQAVLQQQQLQQQALHSGSSSSLVGSSLHSENGVGEKGPRVLATASFPCKNFINYSQEAMLLEDNCLALPINIEETMAVLTRCSFDESHRQPISLLGGIPALAELIQVEKIIHGDLLERTPCSEVRRYAVVALTNLTFGNASIKSFLCSSPGFVPVMVQQLGSPFENLRKATAHLFRNLAWKADKASKSILSDSNVISVLMRAAMDVAQRVGEDPKEEATLKVVLSALWNLSAHCGKNKADICAIDGSLPFLVHLLQSDCVAVVENGGGILRNISSYIATCSGGEKYRSVLRDHNCLFILLQQLKSPSLTIVSNACGTLWNFSARNREDQHALWQMDAVPMLKSLTHSKHKTIATCSAAALKNLTAAKPVVVANSEKGSNASSSNGSGLEARRRRNLMVELDDKLTETCDNIEGNSSDESGSDDDKGPQGSRKSRPESCGSVSSTPSVTSNYADISSGSGVRASRPAPQVPEEDGTSSPATLVQRHPLELSKSRKQMFMKQASPEVSGYPSFPQSDPSNSHGFFRSSSSTEFHPSPQTFQRSSFSVSSTSLQFTEVNSTIGPPAMVNNFMTDKGSASANGERIMSASKIHLFQNSFHEQNGNDLEDDDMDERPRDYSLRFQDAEDPDLSQERARACRPAKVDQSDDIEEETEDTVKTFCTEGTPYDTPCLISTATSMSDLRDPDLDTKMFHKRPSKATLSSDQFQPASGTFSGMDTPSEKPQVFDTEGTPGFFSRADSLSSLGSEDVQDNPRDTQVHQGREEAQGIASPGDNGSVEKGQIEANGGCTKEGSNRSMTPPLPDGATCAPNRLRTTTTSSSHNKQVTFNQQDTPMMFSRCSSFESLNSFDQQSIRDGYSSCDFSRATSGRVSPSDLPDSPGDQSPARPRSPALMRPLAADPRSHGTTSTTAAGAPPPMGTQESQKGTKSSLPSERTGTTAVSGVDRGAREEGLNSKFDHHEQAEVSSTLPQLPNSEAFGTSGSQTLEPVDEKSNGSKDTDEEDIYAETLLSNITKLGMPNDISRPDSRKSRSGIPVAPSKTKGHYSRSSASSCYEAPRQFATEDTPIALSQAGSQTNLSTLTCEDDLVLNKSLDTSGDKTDDSDLDIENIILAGMNSKAASRSFLPMGERGTGEGAPSVKSPGGAKGAARALTSTSSKFGFHKKPRGTKSTTSNGTVSKTQSSTNHPDPRFMLDTPSSGRSRHPSNHRTRLQSGSGTAASSNLTSGRETPVHFATEDTPHVFSRCDSSLSSLSAEDPPLSHDDFSRDKDDLGDTENTEEKGDLTASSKRSTPSSAGVFRSHLPRPQALGRSESSGSSTKSSRSRTGRSSPHPNRTAKSSESDDDDDDDDEELMACVINIGMPKSKSEPLDLKAANGISVVKREKKSGSASSKNRRSTSKSPRNSKVIPGVRIAELKLKPRSTSQEKESLTLPLQEKTEPSSLSLNTPVNDDLGVSQMWTDESPNCAQIPRAFPPANKERTDSMIDTLTVDNALKLSDTNNISTSEEAVLQMEAERVSQQVQDEASMVSSVCSTLSTIQPPSLMLESLMSISGERTESQPNDTHKSTNLAHKSPPKKVEKGMECRHTLSAKKGFVVPEMVRRALGVGGNPTKDGSNEDLSSLSSCQSNLDNIKPPTLMEEGGDMDNSMMSLASLNSEVVDMGSSNETNAGSTDNEKIFDLASTGRQIMNTSTFETSEAPELMGIEPPTIMDDISGVMSTCSKTLVPETAPQGEDGATYVIESGDAGQSTCQDITDVFDDDTTIERSDPLDDDEAPELPRDSRHTTPAQSGGESSLENTPRIKRKLVSGANLNVDYYRQYRVPVPDLDDSSDMAGQDTSGYKSETTVPSNPKSSVQRRKEEIDRFRTHTISKSDLVGTDSSSSSSTPQKKSPKSIKQKREEDGDRFKTHVITPADLKQPSIPVMSPMEVKLIAEDAQLVVDAIKSTKAKTRSRSSSIDMLRASSIEILDEKDMKLSNDFSGSEPSLHLDVQQPIAKGPRVCKPWESRAAPVRKENEEREEEAEVRGIRGRRKPLYASPPKRSTVPPAIPPKPILAPKPKSVLSAPVQRQGSPPTQIRGTRASNLRQVNTRGRMNSPPSPKLSSPRSRGSISSISSISSRASTVSTRSNRSQQKPPPAPLIRQGTFTKEESSSSPNQSGEETRIPPRVAPKPMIRRDLVHPVASQRPPVSTATRSAVKMTPVERGRSNSTQMSAPADLRGRNPRIMQTKTSQLRERSSSRSSRVSTSPREATNLTQLQRYPSTSSASSLASGRSSVRSASAMKTSSSSHALKTNTEANRLTKRVPSSSSIDQQKTADSSNISDIQSESGTPGTGPKKPKREVTSRIASLWKKVEDSKKKNKECTKDPRVWIAQGKVIPEHELELLKPHAEQKQIISNFQAQRQDHSSSSLAKTEQSNQVEVKPRSRSRLSMRLSKFAKPKKDKDSKTPTSPMSPCSTQDSVNGNSQTVSPSSPIIDVDDVLGNGEGLEEIDATNDNDLIHKTDEDSRQSKRRSRLGTFLNPEGDPNSSNGQSSVIQFRNPNNRSPQSAAIVPPFNYNPPTMLMGPPPPPRG
ncbi:hypothetical protein TCAL_09734, partial [Tigriopus californicus]